MDQPNLNQEQPVKEMTFFDHLDDLRKHLIRAVLYVLATSIVVFSMKNFVFDDLIMGPRYKDFPTYRFFCWLADQFSARNLCIEPPNITLETRELGETFLTHMKVSFFLGFVVAFPFVLWELWKFIRPGLYESEQKAVTGFVAVCSLLFFLGVLFGYFIMTPFAYSFLASYEIDGVTNAPTLTSYVSYLIMFTLPIGLVFELPIIVYFLSKMGIVTPEFMKQYRRHAIVLVFILAAIITPPDPMTLMLIALPLMLLYEISIYVSRRASKSYQKALQ